MSWMSTWQVILTVFHRTGCWHGLVNISVMVLGLLKSWLEENGLTLYPDKTHIGDCSVRGEGFDFLGYRFELRHRFVRRKSLKALLDKVRSKSKRSCGKSMAPIFADLNPMLRGWFEYFKHAHRRTFRPIDGFIRRRLRTIRRHR